MTYRQLFRYSPTYHIAAEGIVKFCNSVLAEEHPLSIEGLYDLDEIVNPNLVILMKLWHDRYFTDEQAKPEIWQFVSKACCGGNLVWIFKSSTGMIRNLPDGFIQTFLNGGTLDCAIVPSQGQPQQFLVTKGTKTLAVLPASLLDHLIVMRENQNNQKPS